MNINKLHNIPNNKDYIIGDIIKHGDEASANCCGVVVGWDHWLRPMVFRIYRGTTGMHIGLVTLNEFEAGCGSHLNRHADDVRKGRESAFTDAVWGRAQRLLKAELCIPDSLEANCEHIALFVVTGVYWSARDDEYCSRKAA
jgi:hypothetical protein